MNDYISKKIEACNLNIANLDKKIKQFDEAGLMQKAVKGREVSGAILTVISEMASLNASINVELQRIDKELQRIGSIGVIKNG